RQIGLGPLGNLVAPQEPRLQGDGSLRQDTLGRSQAAAPPPPARPPRAAQAPDFTYRYIFGRSDLDCCPRAGERGTLRGGSSSTRGEPATPSRPAPWRPLPASGLGRLQAVRLRLLRQAGEPGLGQGCRLQAEWAPLWETSGYHLSGCGSDCSTTLGIKAVRRLDSRPLRDCRADQGRIDSLSGPGPMFR